MRGATYSNSTNRLGRKISTHAPHARRDSAMRNIGKIRQFLLTRLMRGATMRKVTKARLTRYISTHAPHARRDYSSYGHGYCHLDFYSRASCEARLMVCLVFLMALVFLLTRLMRGATFRQNRFVYRSRISTHAPHARRDLP